MLDHMKASGIAIPENVSGSLTEADSPPSGDLVNQAETALLPTPSVSTASPSGVMRATLGDLPTQHDGFEVQYNSLNSLAEDSLSGGQTLSATESAVHQWQVDPYRRSVSARDEDGCPTSALSHCEARVAGVFHEQGRVSSVHGLSGMMNPNLRQLHTKNISNLKWKGEAAVAESKARLISNAALQKQREITLFRQPQNLMDLNGCAPGLAKRLLDLHFRRHYYGSIITYRPAFMDSLGSGGGPWANKVLLNAIFYSSAMYSDWDDLQSDSSLTDSMSGHFYDRFKALLAAEIDRPSIPSAAALLLVSATLISQGQSSAGWTMSGTAYRMILDLGCHMIIDPNYQDGRNPERPLQLDLEQEVRKRIYWGAYVTDAAQALYLGRPCMFSCVEARVPLQLLDTFEEFELWTPPNECTSRSATWRPSDPQPSYTLSTFMSLARLLRISTKITELYGIQTIKLNSDTLLDKYRSIEWELESWKSSLPPHLHVDENSTFAPPAHQFIPHVTFHALAILLHRAYMEEGHLRRHSNEAAKRRGEEACTKSALAIEKYLRMYRNAFSLRRAPFLLSYAAYSAVTVILHQEQQNRGQYADKICFFWTCLNELHRGSNLGLKKPLKIIQDVVRELQINIDQGALTFSGGQLQPSLDESSFSLPSDLSGAGLISVTNPSISADSEWDILDNSDPIYGMSPMGFLNGQEKNISHDALYGLFAPAHSFS
ncbi:hypothetical protein H2200_007086 [Cladophialophora chaetospira]|uniref:Xylanolytic transcriptional activator regulatory domain-containing protein n=1 Tax=Cladophialophora chaetospira TaxID=386627 RepID=A0AA39CHA6_9EURO|nr:hypothetical protein H2200_007086 [Cladophialophora chaetospira]